MRRRPGQPFPRMLGHELGPRSREIVIVEATGGLAPEPPADWDGSRIRCNVCPVARSSRSGGISGAPPPRLPCCVPAAVPVCGRSSGRRFSPTSSSSALPVNSPRPRFGGNGQNRGNLPLLKRTAVAAKRGGMAPWCPAAASLSLSLSWPALLVNCAPQRGRSSVEGGSTCVVARCSRCGAP